MRTRRLLLAATALTTVLGACDKTKAPVKYANEKGSRYPMPLDAGVDAVTDATPDAAVIAPPAPEEIHANPKGSFYDDGLAKPPTEPAP